VNYVNVQKYLSALRSSGFFSEAYLTRTYQYFKECDKKMTASKQNDGPPEGLDADLLLYDQDPEGILHDAPFMKITTVAAAPKGLRQVKAETFDNNLIFTMSEVPGRFLVDDIKMQEKNGM
jgi:hypothetical protein